MKKDTVLVENTNEGYGDFIFSMSNPVEEERLKQIALSHDNFSKQHLNKLKKIGLLDDFRCLDVGSGYGTVPLWLIEDEFRASEVVALDKDIRFLQKNVRGEEKIKVIQSNINDIDHLNGKFDYIHVRFVLEHMRNRHEVITKLKSWLKPGGWLTVTNFYWCDKQLADNKNKILMKEFLSIMESRIGYDPHWMKHLSVDMNEQGFNEVIFEENTVIGDTLDSLVAFWQITLNRMKIDILKNPDITEEIFLEGINQTKESLIHSYYPRVIAVSGRI